MKEKGYLTVAEYAKIKNISKQAVYKALDKRLQPFVQLVEQDGKPQKVISVAALGVEDSTGCSTSCSTVEQPNLTQKTEKEQAEIELLKETLATLQEQLKTKDMQIENLQKEVATLHSAAAEKDKHIIEQSQQLSILLAQQQELTRNNQVLLALQEKSKESSKKGLFGRLFHKKEKENDTV